MKLTGYMAEVRALEEKLASGVRRTGEFCWFNLLTPQPAEARDFFSQLLEWTYVEIPGVGHTVQVQGRPVGGLFDVVSAKTPDGTAPGVFCMVKVESADATCQKVTSLGGSVGEPPFDIGDNLRLGMCADLDGAKFDLWEPKRAKGTDVERTQHGAPSWFQLMARDSRRSAAFYAALFGWSPEVLPALGGYTNFKQGDARVAGMMQIAKGSDAVPHWAVFFTVRSAPEAERKGKALGADLLVPLETVPGVGRFLALTSPQGVAFHLVEYG